MLKLEDYPNLELYTEEGKEKIKEAIKITNKMLNYLKDDELETLFNFSNEFRFGLFDLLNAEFMKRKPEFYK